MDSIMCVAVYFRADKDNSYSFDTNVIVTSSGAVSWMPPAVFISTCAMNIQWFPFDEQTCQLKLGSWTFDASKLNLTLTSDQVDISNYEENGAWRLVGKYTSVFPSL